MKKTLIAYYSNSGTAAKIAKHLKELLPEADLDRIGYAGKNYKQHTMFSALFKVPGSPKIEGDAHDPAAYERVILIFPVWASAPAPVMRSYVKKYTAGIKEYGFATVSGGDGSNAEAWLKDHIQGVLYAKMEIRQKDVQADNYNLTALV